MSGEAEVESGERRNPYLFIMGCPRSGTTLLQRMLDHHPEVAVVNEARFIPLAVAEAPDGVDQRLAPLDPQDATGGIDPLLAPEHVERARSYKRFPRLGLPETAVREAASTARSYGEFVDTIFSEFGRLQGKPLAGDKSGFYCLYVPLLRTLLPWVKFIHIIRDGRDVTLSVLEWARKREKGPRRFSLWREEPIATSALWWRWYVTEGRRHAAELGPGRYCEVQYETLVANPEETLREVTGFLELPFAPEMLAYHEGKTRRKRGLSSKKKWLPPTEGLRSWQTQMTERNVELFEAIAGDLLSTLGYKREVDSISPQVAEVAEQCEGWWRAEMERIRTLAAGTSAGPR